MGGAHDPEELDTLLEDAIVLRDVAAVARLYDPTGVLVVGDRSITAGGPAGRVGGWLCGEGCGYVADPRRVVTARNVALVIGADATHVARRDRGGWRFLITVLGAPSGS